MLFIPQLAVALHHANSRLCSEEIAFYKGAEVEKRRIMDSFQSMLKQIMKVSTSSPSV